LKTSIDSLSYAIGVLDGNFFRMQGVNSCNEDLIGNGFNDAIRNKALITPQQADQIVRKELQKLTLRKIQPNIEECNRFLAENKKRKEILVTPSGLQYEVLQTGTGPKPVGDTCKVKVHYEGFLLNGNKFDSSRDRGEPTTFSLNQVIRAWTEGLQLMPVGSKYKFYVPYQLGYGEMGNGPAIPGGSALIFEVELLEIVK
jgi:FKBP-type peptidyl-prolyl cis-trans isomerase